MSIRMRVQVFSLAVATLLGAAFAADAATLTGGFTATPGCSNFSSTVGTFTSTRDNTGTAQEAYYYEVVDGAGTVVARYPAAGTYTNPFPYTGTYGGATLGYTSQPAFNPLTVRWVSPAGNGQPEQVFYENVAFCASLPNAAATVPTLGGWGVALLSGLLAAAGVLALARGRGLA